MSLSRDRQSAAFQDADHIACFGYGSLVNRKTLPPGTDTVPIRVTGYRRAWRLSGEGSFGPRCTLTVVSDPNYAILGVAVRYPLSEVEALDMREVHYDRIQVPSLDVEWLNGRPNGWADPFVFVGKSIYARSGDHDHPVYLSYVDTVLAGFLAEFGLDGAEHFAETTLDWHAPIVDDRAAPVYPRAVALSETEQRHVDAILKRLQVTLI